MLYFLLLHLKYLELMIEFLDQETEFMVPGGAGLIQCKAMAGRGEKAEANSPIAIICHPHPLYAGTMDNKVVTTLARTFRDRGWSYLRFNFRGVGKSEGVHDHMHGESEDLNTLLDLIIAERPGQKIVLAGFSFGSGVASMVAQQRTDIAHLVVVGPPISKYQYAYHDSYPCALSVYQGAEDDVVEPQAVRDWSNSLTSPYSLHWFDGVGHFFHGSLKELSLHLNEELDKG